jgi:hypothetical protein
MSVGIFNKGINLFYSSSTGLLVFSNFFSYVRVYFSSLTTLVPHSVSCLDVLRIAPAEVELKESFPPAGGKDPAFHIRSKYTLFLTAKDTISCAFCG